jgi:phospholipase C
MLRWRCFSCLALVVDGTGIRDAPRRIARCLVIPAAFVAATLGIVSCSVGSPELPKLAIKWDHPSPIVYGTALGSNQLNATANVAGTLVYTPAAGTLLSAGTQVLSATFTPTDTASYSAATASVTLTVRQATPPITWPVPPPVTFTMAINSTQQDATSPIPGTFSYNPAGGFVPRAGTQMLRVTFTPTDSTDYPAVTASVALTVNPATPSIAWSAPAPIVSGTILAAGQLDATANVPGSFVYSPAAGTVLKTGTQTLSAAFTPTDTADYLPTTATTTLTVSPRGPLPIQHVVVIMQENRSFDNLFNGFPGADTVQSGPSYGEAVTLQAVPLEQGTDVDHGHQSWWHDWDNGAMDGFTHPHVTYPTPNFPYAYVPQSETVPIWTLAAAYSLGDRMFQSNSGPSFPAHQYMIAGQSGQADENPEDADVKGIWGCDAPAGTTVPLLGPNGTDLPGVFPCFTYQTLADEMDAQSVSWRYYATSVTGSGYIWSAFDAIQHVRFGSEWTTNVISPNTKFFTDLQNGELAQVTWIVPGFAYSDHAGPGSTAEGPDWVADLVNAIGASQFWDSTAVLISWDDWGGWYDHVNPPQIDNMGLGFRVPLIVVSPWAKHGYVSHQQHEFGSFLHFTEEAFDLPSLGTRDSISDDLSDCFDFTQTPQPYVQVPTTFSPSYFTAKKASSEPPDDD